MMEENEAARDNSAKELKLGISYDASTQQKTVAFLPNDLQNPCNWSAVSFRFKKFKQ